MTRSSPLRRAKRVGPTPREAYERGWSFGRADLVKVLTSPEGMKALDGTVYRIQTIPPVEMVEGDL